LSSAFSPVAVKVDAAVSGHGRQLRGAAIRLPGLCDWVSLWKKGVLFGCSTWWKFLLQCTDRLIPAQVFSYSGLVLALIAVW
jgi:hypothetical protein